MRYAFAVLSVLLFCASTEAAVIVTMRGDLTGSGAKILRQEVGGGTEYNAAPVHNDSDFFNSLSPEVNEISSSSSGSIYDNATGAQLVASGNGSASATSSLLYSGGSLINYGVIGSYSSSLTTGTLSGYFPVGTPPDSEAVAEASPGYNSGISFLVSGSAYEYAITVAQSAATGTVFNAATFYLDANNDSNYNAADGDLEIESYFVVSGNGTLTRTGVIAPSSMPYRLLFYGNIFNQTSSDDVTLTSSASYVSTMTLSEVPEPTGLASLLLATLAMRRRRVA